MTRLFAPNYKMKLVFRNYFSKPLHCVPSETTNLLKNNLYSFCFSRTATQGTRFHWRIQGGMLGARPPLWDPILSFWHTFSLKSACIGGPCPPPPLGARPPTGNPGSATGIRILRLGYQQISVIDFDCKFYGVSCIILHVNN